MRTHSYFYGTLVTLIALFAIGYAGFLSLRETRTTKEIPVPTPTPIAPAIETPQAVIASELPEPTLVSPLSGTKVRSPLVVSGSAVGNWYFEASFPVLLVDAKGVILAEAPAQAQGDWMTTTTVPFLATLTWATTTATSATLILKKDNPSGDPKRDQEVEIPLSF